jgi:addiction module RelE/StbE family toxin
MRILFQKSFEKQFKRLPKNVRQKVFEKNLIFGKDPYHPILKNHALHGEYAGYRSINITGNLRAIYRLLDNDTALFVAIGTHTRLYK